MTERANDGQVGDEELVAYLDGALDAAGFAAVEDALTRDPALRARLQTIAEATSLVRESFDEVLREPVPPALLKAARGQADRPAGATILAFRPRLPRHWATLAAAASVAAILIGGSADYLLGGDGQPGSGALDNIAGYHNLIIASANAGDMTAFDVPAGDETKLPVDIRIPDMKPWGLAFQGARKMVVDHGKPAYQFVYTTSNKELGTITVTLWKSDKPEMSPTFDRRENVNIMYWRHAGLGCAIVGQANKGYMWNMAQDVAWQLRNG